MSFENVIDKIENKSFDKQSKALLILAIFTSILALLNFTVISEITERLRILDFFLLLLPAILYYFFWLRRKKWGGQYIQWAEKSISYKGRETKSNEIEYKDIEDIKIKMDNIEFILKDGSINILGIEDYIEYEDRMRIKKNFEILKKTMPNIRYS